MPLRDGSMGLNSVPSLELTHPQPKVYLKMIFPLPNVRSVSSLEGMNVHDKHHPLQKNVESGVESFTYHDWTLWKIQGIPSDPPQLKFEIVCLGFRATHADPVDELSTKIPSSSQKQSLSRQKNSSS